MSIDILRKVLKVSLVVVSALVLSYIIIIGIFVIGGASYKFFSGGTGEQNEMFSPHSYVVEEPLLIASYTLGSDVGVKAKFQDNIIVFNASNIYPGETRVLLSSLVITNSSSEELTVIGWGNLDSYPPYTGGSHQEEIYDVMAPLEIYDSTGNWTYISDWSLKIGGNDYITIEIVVFVDILARPGDYKFTIGFERQ